MNVAKLVNMRSNPILREDVMRSDLIGIDGMGIVLAARLLAIPVQERVTGIDLFQALLAVCAREEISPVFARRKTGRIAEDMQSHNGAIPVDPVRWIEGRVLYG